MALRPPLSSLKDIVLTLRQHVELRLLLAILRAQAEVGAADRHQCVVRLLREQPQALGVVRPVLVQVLQTTRHLPPSSEEVGVGHLRMAQVEEVALQLHLSTRQSPYHVVARRNHRCEAGVVEEAVGLRRREEEVHCAVVVRQTLRHLLREVDIARGEE